ncbi:hypothetical protein JOC34_002773 [Virgibacillus halotolerans]|uniref:hypothetical protein n=1 Tax=Virgibacillus halotolerans TaxID=1071053 RepID=UPI0030B84AB1|nr:hypothetical protein [Virgibacillus halotolerans]
MDQVIKWVAKWTLAWDMETIITTIITTTVIATITKVQNIGTNRIDGGNMKKAGIYLPAFIFLHK